MLIGTAAPSELLNIKSTNPGQDAIIKIEAQSSSNLELSSGNGLTNTEVVLVFILEMRI